MRGVKGTTPPCSIGGCARPSKVRGLCAAHYARKKRYGDPLAPMRRAPSGAGSLNGSGYRVFNHGRGPEREHIMIAERALGHLLPVGAVVHHANGMRDDNRPENLVICPSTAYHALLHLRMRSIAAGHPPHFRICTVCGLYDDPEALSGHGRESLYHARCHAEDVRARKARSEARAA